MDFDLEMTDALLSTTRSVRKRLDTERPVPRSIIEECIGLSQQAPTGTNSQGWRWIIVEDKAKRERLAEIYRMAAGGYLAGQEAVSYTHFRAHETVLDLVCRLLLEKKKNQVLYIVHAITRLQTTATSESVTKTFKTIVIN